MRILSLSLDNSILNKFSALARRQIEYGSLVEKYDIIVPGRKFEKIELSGKTVSYGSGGSNKLRQFFKIYQTAKKLLRHSKYQVITVPDQYYLALIGLRLAKKFKVGLEIQVHGFERFYGLRKLIAKFVLPRANVVRCVSQRLKKQLISQFGLLEDKITVVSIFTDTTLLLREAEPRGNLISGKFIFLTVGRLVSVKNIGLQIEAMAEVAQKHANIELWIIGDGPELARLEKLSCELGLRHFVKFLGWKDDLNEYYNAAEALVLTANYEGWGLAVIEAASHGLPIIMTEVGCAGEVIKHGESGLVISIGSKEELVLAMTKIIKDENLRKKLGANAKLAVDRLPTREQTLELYKNSWEKAALK